MILKRYEVVCRVVVSVLGGRVEFAGFWSAGVYNYLQVVPDSEGACDDAGSSAKYPRTGTATRVAEVTARDCPYCIGVYKRPISTAVYVRSIKPPTFLLCS